MPRRQALILHQKNRVRPLQRKRILSFASAVQLLCPPWSLWRLKRAVIVMSHCALAPRHESRTCFGIRSRTLRARGVAAGGGHKRAQPPPPPAPAGGAPAPPAAPPPPPPPPPRVGEPRRLP